jgi:copper(I)-binding protein
MIHNIVRSRGIRMSSIRTAAAAAFALLASLSSLAQTAADSISVVDPYVRAPAPNAPATGAFMVLKNPGPAEHKLVKAESPAARVVELHDHIDEGGVKKMRPVAAIAIAAKGEAVLKPGSLHVMLIDLKKPLAEGDSVPITLGFDDGSSKRIDAPVRKLQMQMPSVSGMQH